MISPVKDEGEAHGEEKLRSVGIRWQKRREVARGAPNTTPPPIFIPLVINYGGAQCD